MREIRMVPVLCAIVFGAAVGCGDQTATQSAGERAEEVGTMLEENVEHSEEVYEETYDKSRVEGENVIDAAGDAYNAVLDEANEKKKKAPE